MKKAKMAIHRISSIGRPLSFKYPTNRAIIIIVASVFIFGILIKLVAGDSFTASIVWAFGAAAALFFAWALARELDPDGNASAFIATAFMFVALFFADLPAILALFWILLVTRILNRITGVVPKLLDLTGVIILAVVLSWQELWVYGLITALALYANSWMDGEKKKGIILVVLVLSLLVLSVFFGNSSFTSVEISVLAIVAASFLTLLFIPVMCIKTKIKSLTDVTREPVSANRMRLVRILAVVTGIMVTTMQGNTGFINLLPLWAAIGGIVIWNYYRSIKCCRK
ncbi:hypothetical protein ACFLUX_00360 [Chloroflexota bacterium]